VGNTASDLRATLGEACTQARAPATPLRDLFVLNHPAGRSRTRGGSSSPAVPRRSISASPTATAASGSRPYLQKTVVTNLLPMVSTLALCVLIGALLVTAQEGVLPEYPAAGSPVLPFFPIRSFQRSSLSCVTNLNQTFPRTRNCPYM
jgi:hypothetical protein